MNLGHCILVRHAHAEWPQYAGRDFDRPLTARGLAQAHATGEAIRTAGLVPSRLIASPALRTRQTADVLAKELGMPPDAIRFVTELYNADAATLEAALREAGGALPLLVAHNPGISDLARHFAGDGALPPLSPADWRHLQAP